MVSFTPIAPLLTLAHPASHPAVAYHKPATNRHTMENPAGMLAAAMLTSDFTNAAQSAGSRDELAKIDDRLAMLPRVMEKKSESEYVRIRVGKTERLGGAGIQQ